MQVKHFPYSGALLQRVYWRNKASTICLTVCVMLREKFVFRATLFNNYDYEE